jgi:hypothetical protein
MKQSLLFLELCESKRKKERRFFIKLIQAFTFSAMKILG